jgi:hypothetical protein
MKHRAKTAAAILNIGTRRYFFSVTQTRSIGFVPMFLDWCPTLISIVRIQPTSPSGEKSG